MIRPFPNNLVKLCAAAGAGLLAAHVFPAGAQDLSPASVAGLRVETESTNVLLTWPTDPRETFAVLWRSNTHWQTPWVVLTNQLRASPSAAQTTFRDLGALPRLLTTNTNLADSYRVFAVPDFWFDMSGVQFEGGPEHCGEDFLPFYYGTTETRMFKPQLELLVDGQSHGVGSTVDENVQRVNFGTVEKPRWAYTAGFWFHHGQLPDGEHILQIQSRFELNNTVGPWSWSVTLTSRPVRVCVAPWRAEEEVKGGQKLLGIRRARAQPSWWERRLGRSFVRKRPTPEELARHFIYSEADDLPSKVQPRPWKSRFPAGASDAASP
jgi:hypothetical protein